MSASIKAVEIYAAIGLKPDSAQWKRGDKMLKDFHTKVQKFNKDISSKLGGSLGMAGIGAMFGLAAKNAITFEDGLVRLGISSKKTVGSLDLLKTKIEAISGATAIAKEDILAGIAKYVERTGDGAGGADAARTFAEVAQASGTAMDDVALAAASMREQFGILPADFKQAFSILIEGGKAGAVELRQMAELTAGLGASFKDFSGSQGLGGAAALGAMFQTVMKDSKTAEEAANNLENLFAKIKTRRAELAKIGVRVEEGEVGSGRFKSVMEIVRLLDEAKNKNFSSFQDAFGADMQANKALDGLRKRIAAVHELTDATRSSQAVAEDLAEYQQSSAFRAKKAWNDLKVAIAAAFTPERVKQLAEAMQGLAGFVLGVVDAVGGVDKAVWLVVGAFGALKALELGTFLTMVASKLLAVSAAGSAAAAATGGIGGAAGVLGLGAKAGLLGLAGAVGYGAGTLIDNAPKLWGGRSLSDRLAGVEGDTGPDPIMEAQRKQMAVRPFLPAWLPGLTKSDANGSAFATPAPVTINQTINVAGVGDPKAVGDRITTTAGRRAAEAAARRTQAATGG